MQQSQSSENKSLKKLSKLLEQDASPGATLIKSYLRDTNDYSLINTTLNELDTSDISSDTETGDKNHSVTSTPEKTANNMAKRKPRFDVSCATALFREKYPFRAENYAELDEDEIEEEPLLEYHELLKGLHMYVDVREKEDNRSSGIKTILRRMGATVHDKLDKGVTHVIFREGTLGTYKKARRMNCHILSILWVDAIKKARRRVPEACYPALNLELYESPNAVKKIRRYKCMTPDYDSAPEKQKTRKRVQVTKTRRLISDSDEPSNKIDNVENKRRRTTMHTSTLKMNQDVQNQLNESSDSDFSVAAKRRKTENWNSTNLTLTSKESKHQRAILDNKQCTKRFSEELKNRNVVVNRTLSPSVPCDLIEGSQDLHPFRIHKSKVVQHSATTDSDSISSSSVSSELKNSSLHSSTLKSSGPTKNNGEDNVDSADLQKVLEALENDKNGSLRKRLLQGLGLKVDECKQTQKSTKSSPEEVKNEAPQDTFITKRKRKLADVTTPEVAVTESTLRKNRRRATIISTDETPSKANLAEITTPEVAPIEPTLTKSHRRATIAPTSETPLTVPKSKTENSSTLRKTRSVTRRQTLTSLESEKKVNDQTESSKRRINRRSLFPTEAPLREMNETPGTRQEKNPVHLEEGKETEENMEDQIKPPKRRINRRSLFPTETPLRELNETPGTRQGKDSVDLEEGKGNEENMEEQIKPPMRRINRRSLFPAETPLRPVQLNGTPGGSNEKKHDETLENQTTSKRRVNRSPVETPKVPETTKTAISTRRRSVLRTETPLRVAQLNGDPETPGTSTGNREEKTVPPDRRITQRSPFQNSLPPQTENNINSTLNSTTTRTLKKKLFNLKECEDIGSDVSLPETMEPVPCPYLPPESQTTQKTPKRRPVNLNVSKSVDHDRRSSQWFQNGNEIKSVTKIDVKKSKSIKSPTIVCTRLHRDQIDIFEQVVKKLGQFEVENHVSERTTHLVAGESQRTINMLRAIIRGCWIVKYDWILASLEAGEWLDEEKYELTEFSPAVQKCRIERQTFGEPYKMKLFNDCGEIHITKETSPKPSELEYLIKLAGGHITPLLRKAKIIIGQAYRNNEDAVCVNEKWVLDSISQKRVKSFKKYLILDENR